MKVPIWMPVCLPAAAAVLRGKGHHVRIVERGHLYETAGRDRLRMIDLFREDVAGLGPDMVVFDARAEVLTDLGDFGRAARRGAPGSLILAAGRHPTLLPESTIETNDFLDGVVIGEPEPALESIAAGAGIDTAPSVAFGGSGGIVNRGRGDPPGELDDIPYPAWDLMDMDYHAAKTSRVIPCLYLRTATVETSRGCGRNCSFCSEGRFNSPVFRFHSPGYVTGMIRKLIGDYGVEGIYFSDEMFLNDVDRVGELCEAMLSEGLHRRIRWSAQVRADSVGPAILEKMKEAGCVQLEFGIESGSRRVLDSVSKGAGVERNAEALAMSRAAGIRSMAYIMYALPGETAGDMRLTGEFISRAKPDIVRLLRFIPIPGTPAVDDLISTGRLEPDFWIGQVRTGDPFGGERVNLTAMSDEVLRRETRRLYFGHSFPRFALDFLRHHPPWTFPSVFNTGALIKSMGRKLTGEA